MTPSGTPEPPALSIEGVSFRFPRRLALDHVSATVAPGQFAVLLGANGAGKTTLFSLVTGLYAYREGSIRIYGHDVRQTPRQALAKIGVVFQQSTMDLDLSVRRNLLYHAALHGLDGRTARRRAQVELERHGLADRAGERVRALSGGQRRRVELARSVMHEPRLLLLDEPTVGLDIHSRRAILEHVRALCRDAGMGALWATHLTDEVRPEDHLVVLKTGKVQASGTVSQVLEATGTDTVDHAFTALTRDAR